MKLCMYITCRIAVSLATLMHGGWVKMLSVHPSLKYESSGNSHLLTQFFITSSTLSNQPLLLLLFVLLILLLTASLCSGSVLD